MPAPNPDTLKQGKDVPLQMIAFAVAPVPDTQKVYLGCSDFKVYAADLADAKPEFRPLYAHESYVTGVALAGPTLVSGGYDGKLTWFDTEGGKTVRTVAAHARW